MEIRRDDCGGVPVNLMANYMYTLRRKNAKKLEHVKSRIYLNVLRHVIKCLPLPTKDASIWWKYHGENQEREQYTKVTRTVPKMNEFRKFATFSSLIETIMISSTVDLASLFQ